jgi:murein L,D-transpeptidase YcbB/YkuD
MLGSAACAALMMTTVPTTAATVPEAPAPFRMFGASGGTDVDAFYASRRQAPLWLRDGPNSPAARELISVLQRAPIDGLASGPELAGRAQALISQAPGDPATLLAADKLLSSAWVQYVQAIHRPPRGMTYADAWVAPRSQSPGQILQMAAAAPSLAAHIQSVSEVNPFYAQLRDAAVAAGTSDPRVLGTLERARALPATGRYIVVDAAGARLWMIENGSIADSMKVIVGKPTSQTPMVASMIYYATLNPYWNVPPDLVQKLVAPRVLQQGMPYLKAHGYQVLDGPGEEGRPIDPAKVDWKAIAAGRATVRVRQLPGPGNSMGQLKFGFANANDVYLHDTPNKDLFAQDDRDLSNGCIRLEDAQRLGRWLIGREPVAASSDPEQHLLLPKPVPVYVTYFTAHADGAGLSLLDDRYGRDTSAQMAALR